MNRAAIFFLILLRLAIGWHFFMEGVQKVESVRNESEAKPGFSSAGYFREATGPAGNWARTFLGDPDAEALALLALESHGEKVAAMTAPHERIPPALKKQWEGLLANYESHYKLSHDQKEEAGVLLLQAQDSVVLWLTGVDSASVELTRKFDSGEVKRQVPVNELIADYRTKLDESTRVSEKLWSFGFNVEKNKYREKRTEATTRRNLLVAGINGHTAALARRLNLLVAEPVLVPLERLDNDLVTAKGLSKKTISDGANTALKGTIEALTKVAEETKDLYPATPEELAGKRPAPIDPAAMSAALKTHAVAVSTSAEKLQKAAQENAEVSSLAENLKKNADELKAKADKLPTAKPLPPDPANERIVWVDWLTRWGLTVMGGCLLIGLLTRTNAWLAAGFLLMTYLAVPPWPWVPSVGPTEGNYLYVNKNLVEMLALCVLGVTATGKWFGVDAIFHWMTSSGTDENKK